MSPLVAISHETALAEANYRALSSGRRQRVMRCRSGGRRGLCFCGMWIVTDIGGHR